MLLPFLLNQIIWGVHTLGSNKELGKFKVMVCG